MAKKKYKSMTPAELRKEIKFLREIISMQIESTSKYQDALWEIKRCEGIIARQTDKIEQLERELRELKAHS